MTGPIKAEDFQMAELSAEGSLAENLVTAGLALDGYFQASDGLKLHYLSSTIDQPAYQILGVHGLGEHAGRYDWFADQIAADGGICSFMDLRGHGLSDGSRGHSPSYAQLLDDIKKFVALQAKDQIPSFFFGHSLGGGLALNYALELSYSDYQPDRPFCGFISASPLLRLSFEPASWKLLLAKLLVKIWPGFSLKRGIDTNNLTRDKDIRAIYLADPLNHELVSAALTLGFLSQGESAIEQANQLRIATLILHGEADVVTDLRSSKEFAERAGKIAEFQSFAKCRHELVNEINRVEVMDAIKIWIHKKI